MAVGFSFDSTYCATGGMDGLTHVSLVQTGEKILTLEGPTEVTVK